MTNWTDLDATMPKFIRENPWILTHDGKCCVLDVVMVTDAMYNEITQPRAELSTEQELADLLAECAAIVQCDVEDVAPDQVWEEISIDNWNNLTSAVQNVRTRRSK